MKAQTRLDAPVIEKTVITQSSVKVCMHVLGTARNDVRVMREATTLRDAGYAVSIVDIEGESNHTVEEVIQGINVKHVFVSRSFLATRFSRWSLIKAVGILVSSTHYLLRSSADIYHAHDVSGLLPCYIAARLRRKPLVFDAHELPLEAMSIRSRWLLELLAYLLMRIIPYCMRVITVSPPIAREISRHYRSPMISIIRNVPTYQAVARSTRLRQYLDLEPEMCIALFQGYLNADRGLDILIRSATFLDPNIVIVIMGKAVGETLAQLESLIKDQGVADRVRIIPAVPFAELLEWTASADLGLIIYRTDFSKNIQMCLPNKFFEYLMAGLPVLASQLNAIEDVIRTYNVGRIVTSLAPANIGEAINAMLVDKVAINEMRRNALDAAQREFHWEKECLELTHLYESILIECDLKKGRRTK